MTLNVLRKVCETWVSSRVTFKLQSLMVSGGFNRLHTNDNDDDGGDVTIQWSDRVKKFFSVWK